MGIGNKPTIFHFMARINKPSGEEIPPKSEATAKGHMNQQIQGIQSTKKKTKNKATTPTEEHYHQVQESGRTFSDQTGRFPHTSSKGKKYIMLWYHYDTNAITTEPLKNRTEGEINRAFEKLHTKLCAAGYTPKCHRIDNECS